VTTAQVVARLWAERRNCRQIVETGSDGVWKIDQDGVTTFANDRMAAHRPDLPELFARSRI
jgi:PAS domain-containing protein